jgi:hypothetical protein
MTSASMRGICLQVAAACRADRSHLTGTTFGLPAGIHGWLAHFRSEPVGSVPGSGT